MKTNYRQSICLLLILSIINLSVTGCGGQNANPVARYLPGDEKKSCNALNAEIANIDNEMAVKKSSKTNRDLGNVIWAVGGIFTLGITWFFLDLKGSQEIEIDALKARKNALQVLYAERNNTDSGIIPEKTIVEKPAQKESKVYSIEVK